MIFTGRNEVVAKVMFLLVSVILSTGGGGAIPACLAAGLWGGSPWQRGGLLAGGAFMAFWFGGLLVESGLAMAFWYWGGLS